VVLYFKIEKITFRTHYAGIRDNMLKASGNIIVRRYKSTNPAAIALETSGKFAAGGGNGDVGDCCMFKKYDSQS
jgi:hypothetical protein